MLTGRIIPGKPKGLKQELILDEVSSADAHKGASCGFPPTLDEHLFKFPGADNCAENIDQGDVVVAHAMKQNDVPDEVGVGLLPERLLALAPDRGDDRGDVVGLGIGVKVIVQRVVTDVSVERDLDVVLFSSA